MTGDLVERVFEHDGGVIEGCTKKRGTETLVWLEVTESTEAAIREEEQIKKWSRARKIESIEKTNRTRRDLHPEKTG